MSPRSYALQISVYPQVFSPFFIEVNLPLNGDPLEICQRQQAYIVIIMNCGLENRTADNTHLVPYWVEFSVDDSRLFLRTCKMQ